ncbi:MAG: hypothetical protein CL760_06595 [Chloroflexi bacterium]|nr:hypothetical protein [Chloroflexota bacterium]|tara:strand:+ start:22150 stop:22410 length:261 start_codon:yes stop_codon:yes gene_type:complete
MCLIKKESILFLSKMAERRINEQIIPLDKVHLYTNIVKHFSDIQPLNIENLSSTLQYIKEEAFKGYPELQSEISAAKRLMATLEKS